jgi:hypothetical protein
VTKIYPSNQYEVELYIPVLNDREEKTGERFMVIQFEARTPTDAMNKALEIARQYEAEFATWGRSIARNPQGLPDYEPKKGR